MKIREFREKDLISIKKIIKKLHPTWFDKKALKNIPLDVFFQKCFIAEEEDRTVGFVSFYAKDGKANLGWIGVSASLRRKGIGRQLIKKVESELKKIGVRVLRVETIGETKPRYKPYEETVAFYRNYGFKVEKKSKFENDAGYRYRMYIFKKMLS